jgi:hypothetical protein
MLRVGRARPSEQESSTVADEGISLSVGPAALLGLPMSGAVEKSCRDTHPRENDDFSRASSLGLLDWRSEKGREDESSGF